MEITTMLAAIGVLVAWGVVSFSIWRWGPGRVRRAVLCPKNRVRARVVIEQSEGAFGSLRSSDVLACSLFPKGQLACGKECLSQHPV